MSHSQRLLDAAREASQARARVAADPALRELVVALKRWQSERLAQTHADLLGAPRYRDAARFFLDDLYGAKDFSRRDAELERVIPVLAKTMPDAALATLADAIELDAMTEDLDIEVARALAETDRRAFDEAAYADAYRAAAPPDERTRQLDLVMKVGRSLDRLVRMPMLGMLLNAMGGPARAAGFGAMHEFLVRGYQAFKGIGGASEFLGRIDARERRIMARLYAGARQDWTVDRDS